MVRALKILIINFINHNDSEWFADFAKTKGCGAPPFVAAPNQNARKKTHWSHEYNRHCRIDERGYVK